MDNEKLVRAWQKRIVENYEYRLRRALRRSEPDKLASVSGFQALEMIEDSVSQGQPLEIERYLVSISVP